MPDLDEWVAELEDDRVNREVSWGWQAWVQLGDTVVLDEARGVDGIRRPLRTDSLHRLYCVGRPFTAVAIATLVDAGTVSFETPLAQVIDGLDGRALGRLTVAELLSHRGGFEPIGAQTFAVLLEDDRRDAVLALEPNSPAGPVAAYDEYIGWFLLGLVIEAATGISWRAYLREAVLAPLGLTDDVFPGFDDDPWLAHGDRVAVNVDLMTGAPVPFLSDGAHYVARQSEPAIGVYASMRGVGGLYTALARCLDGTDGGIVRSETLAAMTTPATERGWDVRMRRDAAYGLGFMVGLADHNFGRNVSAGAFGHGGFRDYGAFFDPTHELIAAIQYVGIIDVERSGGFGREERFEQLYEQLGLVHAPAR